MTDDVRETLKMIAASCVKDRRADRYALAQAAGILPDADVCEFLTKEIAHLRREAISGPEATAFYEANSNVGSFSAPATFPATFPAPTAAAAPATTNRARMARRAPRLPRRRSVTRTAALAVSHGPPGRPDDAERPRRPSRLARLLATVLRRRKGAA